MLVPAVTITGILETTSGPELGTNVIVALGYATSADGGEGIFYWDRASTATDDSVNVIQPSSVSGAGRWIRVGNVSGGSSTGVSVTDFGAVGNGIADDTVALQAAIDSTRDSGGCLLVPAGTYMFSHLDMSLINTDFTTQTVLRGEGPAVSKLKQINGSGGNCLDISGSNWLRFESLGVYTGIDADVGVLASRLATTGPNCNFNSFIDFWVIGATDLGAFVGINNECTSFQRCWFDNTIGECCFYSGAYNTIGAVSAFGTIVEASSNTANTVYDCRFTNSVENSTCIWLSDGAGISFDVCQTYTTGGNTLTAHVFVDAPETNEFGWATRFMGCHFEGDGDVFLFDESANPPTHAVYENFLISGCVCINSGSKWTTVGGTHVSHTNFIFENNAGPFPVELHEVERSRINHIQDGATIVFGGNANGCDIRVQTGGLTANSLCGSVAYVDTFGETAKNYDQYGADLGTAARAVGFVPSTSAPDPTQLFEGMILTAKPPGWDPCSVGGTASYPVFYNGTIWQKMFS